MTQATKFPSWAPKMLCEYLQEGDFDHNPDLVELATRLITYPEMETVWQQYRDWVGSKWDLKRIKNKENRRFVEWRM